MFLLSTIQRNWKICGRVYLCLKSSTWSPFENQALLIHITCQENVRSSATEVSSTTNTNEDGAAREFDDVLLRTIIRIIRTDLIIIIIIIQTYLYRIAASVLRRKLLSMQVLLKKKKKNIYITAMIFHLFIISSAVQIYEFSYIHYHLVT